MQTTLTWCPECNIPSLPHYKTCYRCQGPLEPNKLFDIYPVPSKVQTKSEVIVIRNKDEELFHLVVFDTLPEPGRVWLWQPGKDIVSMSCEEFEKNYRFYSPIFGEQFSTRDE